MGVVQAFLYYSRFRLSIMNLLLRRFNRTLLPWVGKKFKRFKGSKMLARLLVETVAERQAQLLVHRRQRMAGMVA